MSSSANSVSDMKDFRSLQAFLYVDTITLKIFYGTALMKITITYEVCKHGAQYFIVHEDNPKAAHTKLFTFTKHYKLS